MMTNFLIKIIVNFAIAILIVSIFALADEAITILL